MTTTTGCPRNGRWRTAWDDNDDGTVGESAPGAKDGPNGPLGDPDGDTLNNQAEYEGADGTPDTGDETDPQDDDTDDDRSKDGDELTNGTDPNDPDSDGDGLEDGAEDNSGNYQNVDNAGSDPNNPDTDGNGYSDFAEAANGFDPSDAGDPSKVPDAFGWNYVSGRLASAALLPGEVAGYITAIQDEWNSTVAGLNVGTTADLDHNADGVAEGFVKDTHGTNLTDLYGTAVGWASNTNWNTNNGDGSPDSKLMNGYADNTDATNDQYPINNIPYAQYDVVVYVGSDGNGRTGSLALLDAALTELEVFTFATDSAKGGFTPANYTVSSGAGNPPANTIIFPGRTESSIVLEHRRGSNNSGLHGYQIVGSGPIHVDVDNDDLVDSWEIKHFTNLDRTAEEDTNGNGWSNLEDLAYGFDPATPGAVPPLEIDEGAGTITQNGAPTTGVENIPDGVEYSVLYQRRSDAAALGLTITVEFSHDLNTWFPSSDPGTVVAAGSGIEAVKVNYPFFLPNGRKARFWHTVVTAAGQN